jgi:hypothetical protein
MRKRKMNMGTELTTSHDRHPKGTRKRTASPDSRMDPSEYAICNNVN